MNNFFIKTALQYVCQVIEEDIEKHTEWLKEHYEILDNNRLGYFPVFMDLALDSYLETQEQKNIFRIRRS